MNQPCPFCGGADFESGTLTAHHLQFATDDGGTVPRRVFTFDQDRLRGRLCLGCGNVQLFQELPPTGLDAPWYPGKPSS